MQGEEIRMLSYLLSKELREMQGEEIRMLRKELQRLQSKDKSGCSATAKREETEKHPNNKPGESRESVVLWNVKESLREGEPWSKHAFSPL